MGLMQKIQSISLLVAILAVPIPPVGGVLLNQYEHAAVVETQTQKQVVSNKTTVREPIPVPQTWAETQTKPSKTRARTRTQKKVTYAATPAVTVGTEETADIEETANIEETTTAMSKKPIRYLAKPYILKTPEQKRQYLNIGEDNLIPPVTRPADTEPDTTTEQPPKGLEQETIKEEITTEVKELESVTLSEPITNTLTEE